MSAAVFASLFGLGRLQPYVDDPAIENIDVHGCEPVWLSYADGTRARGAPVADSDAELVEMVAAFAAYAGASTREFSTAKPLLDLRLPDGARLSAWMSVSARPGLTIRRHRLADVELADLVPLGTLDAGLVALLTAAVRARKNIVVTGGVNAGKTTLVRALAGAFDPAEKLVVAEKDYELALDALPHRHHQVVSPAGPRRQRRGRRPGQPGGPGHPRAADEPLADHRRGGPRRGAAADAHRDGLRQRRVAVHAARQLRARRVQPDGRDRPGRLGAAARRGDPPARGGRRRPGRPRGVRRHPRRRTAAGTSRRCWR